MSSDSHKGWRFPLALAHLIGVPARPEIKKSLKRVGGRGGGPAKQSKALSLRAGSPAAPAQKPVPAPRAKVELRSRRAVAHGEYHHRTFAHLLAAGPALARYFASEARGGGSGRETPEEFAAAVKSAANKARGGQ